MKTLVVIVSRLLVAMFLFSAVACCQKAEYDFYPEFRNSFTPKLRAANPSLSLTDEVVIEKYAEKLRSERVPETEIDRRTRLLLTERPTLEADYWNRFYTDSNANFNKAPNGFLMQMVEGRQPGAALDYGMGEGRNAIYLATLGWQVWGFDPADAGVALAQKRAHGLGLTLHTAAVRDSEYDFGKERFDLILFSWTMPLVPIEKIVDSLKPGGIVVMECGTDFAGRNGMLHMFDPLQIIHYEIVRAKADFYDRRETDIIRLVAKKP
ncbi:MAG TPA: class I SAM-dependent methyltransferase [Terriglobales bacterium]|nr:class I SAM-dependent methyltransferase [Terriglobales bacterium]